MKKISFYCDRCGKEVEDVYNNRGFHLHKFHVEAIHDDCNYMDLCQKCYDSLAEWVRSGEKRGDKAE